MKKRMLAAVIALSTLFSVGCNTHSETSAPTKQVEIWSTFNTEKVIRQTAKNARYERLPVQISAQMMKGEYEGAQLILTSNTRLSYRLLSGELTNEKGDTFPAENIAIYHQKYVQLSRNYNGNPAFNAGDAVPDMLLPMDIAVEYGENVVSANSNQGVTVEFNSNGVQAGVYTGNFVLEIDGERTSVPVSVEVWDIEYMGRRTFQSSFLLYRDQLPAGEYDNSKEAVDRYIEFLQDYKIDTYVTRDNWEEAHFQESVERFEHPYASSIIIPVDFPLSYRAVESNAQFKEAVNYIVWLANQSTEENTYIEYAYFYPSTYDEADVVPERQGPSVEFFKDGGEYAKTLQAAADTLLENQEFLQKSPALQERILQAVKTIPAVFTNVHYNEEWVREFDTVFCPYISLFDDRAILQRYQAAAEENANGELWAYSCCDPDYPYPTFHIDDTALGMRVNGWMNKAYDVNGYLYYSVNKYSMMHDENANEYVDVYEDPTRYKETNGDGFLMYPGKYYGSEMPFASLRLVSYRDGMDDYDMLCVYEKLLQEKAAQYGVTFDFNEYVSDLYNSLFRGLQAYSDDAIVYEMRQELAKRIYAIQNEDGLVVDLSRVGNEKVVKIYSTASELTVNGNSLQGVAQGEGYCFTLTQGAAANAFTIQVGENEYSYSVNAHTTVSAAGVSVSEGSVAEFADGKATVLIKAIDDPDYKDFLRPSITYAVSGLENVENIRFSYENIGDEELEIRITLLTTKGKIVLSTSYCAVGGAREEAVYVADDYGVDWSTVTAVEISFENVVLTNKGTVLAEDRMIAISNLWFDIR